MSQLMIEDLYLEGFAKIHTGMHIDRVYLDFKNMPNQTYLFIGDSGSGKSSILKSIHPFAFNSATGDESSNSNLIMSGRDGKKIIKYSLDNKEIICKHFYLRKQDGGIQVKSYFSVNGEELNPSGLVSTFKELVYNYFYIDESFLTLLALGNSVRSMVDYTSGERKKLSVKIFTELNIYMTYYKNASGVVKELKTILNNVVDKLDRYGDYDKKDIKKNIRELDAIITESQKDLDNILKSEGEITAKLEANNVKYKNYEECQNKVTDLLTKIEQLKRKKKSTKDVVVLTNDKDALKLKLVDSEIRIESLEKSIASELEFKELKLSSKNQLETSIERMEHNIDKTELEKLLANIDAELSSLSDIEILPDIDYKDKKEELVRANIYLEELRSLCTDLISEVRMYDLIPKVLNGYLKDKHFDSKIDMTYKAVLERMDNLRNTNNISGDIKIRKITYSECKTDDCPYRKFYNDAYEILNAKKNRANEILREEEEKLNTAEQMVIIRGIIHKLYDYIRNHKKELENVPEEIFNPNTFIEKYLSSMDREIFDRDLIGSSVTYLENATRKVELISLQKTTKNQLSGIQTTKEVFEGMKSDLEKTIRAISETEEVIQTHRKDLEFNRETQKELNSSIKEIDIEISLTKELEDTRNEIQQIQKNLSSMEELKKTHDLLHCKMQELRRLESDKREEIQEKRRVLNSYRNMLESIDSLEKEKIELASKYSNAVMVKDAVSPSKGIPVEFIDDVIRNQMIDSINELMHIAYPDITLIKDPDKLVINDKEFTIPYMKNGVIIGDISEASDGERAMLSLAFSLVLIRLVSKVYNIMLLDEMDTSLDKYGRSKYIEIIEQYMKTINAKQIFLISHNSMFDMYKVNVLQTTNSNINANIGTLIIPVYEQNFTPECYKEEVA